MGSTGEADKKRRHVSSISPTATAVKKQPFAPLSEEKKVDFCFSFLCKRTPFFFNTDI